MTPSISVVVPVYNPGSRFDACINSLLGQSLSSSRYEIVLVDDGSTDGTAARLDELAAEHTNVTVIHQPNSGWPGRPRNVGTDAATGEYVVYVDNDDWLAPQALERLARYVEGNEVDIVMFKEIGRGRSAARSAWRRTVEDAQLGRDRLQRILTPHKMFRRAFLLEHGIRFPEGRRRLEDHVFVIQAYFAAKRTVILADYGYYHWARTDDRENASAQRFDPSIYYANLREVLDIVDANTEPGEFRDQLYTHWYAGKVLRRIGILADYEPEYRPRLFCELQELTAERFPPALDTRLPTRDRVRSVLLRAGAEEELTTLSQLLREPVASVRLRDVQWADGALQFDVSARLTHRGEELRFRRDGSRVLWCPPIPLPGVSDDALSSPARWVFRLNALARRLDDGDFYYLEVDHRTRAPKSGEPFSPRFRGVVSVDARTAALGLPLEPGSWGLVLIAGAAGFGGESWLGSRRHQRPLRRLPAGLVGPDLRAVVPHRIPDGRIGVDVDLSEVAALPGRVRMRRASAERTGGRVELTLPLGLITHDLAAAVDGSLRARSLDDRSRKLRVGATMRSGPDGHAMLTATLPVSRLGARKERLTPGRWQLDGAVDSYPLRLGVTLTVPRNGPPTIERTTKRERDR